MKLFIKILLFLLVVLIAIVKAASAIITFPNIQEATAYSLFHTQIPETGFKLVENDLANCCKNEQNLVDYRNWGTGVDANVANTGGNALRHYTTEAGYKAIVWSQENYCLRLELKIQDMERVNILRI